MKSLRERFGRTASSSGVPPIEQLAEWGDWIWPKGMATAVTSGDPVDVVRKWNTLSTLGAGAVADVDAAGCIMLRNRPLAVDVWIGGGDRWWYPPREATVRQSRIEGLPVVETRMKVGDADVVFTAWADESGDARGRVMLQLSTELEVPVVAAIVLRPLTMFGPGSITEARVSGDLMIADRLPVVQLPREAGDTATGSRTDGDVHLKLGDELIGEASITTEDGSATIAAMLPLAPGIDQIVQIIDGREEGTVAPADLHQIVAGWKSHLNTGASIELPGWPKHVPPSLLSGMLGAVASPRPHPGEERPLSDDALLCCGLAQAGFGWAAATMLDPLLEAVTEGGIPRSEWPSVAAACVALGALSSDHAPLERNPDTLATVIGHAVATGAIEPVDAATTMRAAAGDLAADDTAQIRPGTAIAGDARATGRLGMLPAAADWGPVHAAAAQVDGLRDANELGLAMISGARGGDPFDAATPTRALAGTTWRWSTGTDGPGLDRGCGDSPHSRAALFLGLRAQAIHEVDGGLDLLPGFSKSWLGRNLDVNRLPTRYGQLSFHLRWHGARAALLWELDLHDGATPPVFTVRSIDPTFRNEATSGESLLEAPVAEGETRPQ